MHNTTYLGRATALKCWSALEYNIFLSLRYPVYSNQAATAILFSLLAMWALARRVFGPSFISSQCSQRWSHTNQQWRILCIRGKKKIWSLHHFFAYWDTTYYDCIVAYACITALVSFIIYHVFPRLNSAWSFFLVHKTFDIQNFLI